MLALKDESEIGEMRHRDMPGGPWMAESRRICRLVTGAMAMSVLSFLSRAQAGEDEGCRLAVSDRPAQATPIYLHRVVMRYELGEGPRSYWLFEPAEPKPGSRPGRRLLPRLVCRQSGLLRSVDRSSGSFRPYRRFPTLSKRRGHAPQGLPAQRDCRDPRRARRAGNRREARPARP